MKLATITNSPAILGTAFLINAKREEKGLPALDGMTPTGELIDGSPLHRYALRSEKNAATDAFRKGGAKGSEGTRVWSGEQADTPAVIDPTGYDPAVRLEAAEAITAIVAALPPSQALAVRIAMLGLEGSEKAAAWHAGREDPDLYLAPNGPQAADLLKAARGSVTLHPDAVRKATMACRKALQKARIKIADMTHDGGPLAGVEVGTILGKGSGRRVTRAG